MTKDSIDSHAIEMYRIPTASQRSPLAEVLQKEIDAFRRWSGPKKMPD